jgi:hypothetical protein
VLQLSTQREGLDKESFTNDKAISKAEDATNRTPVLLTGF